MLKYDLNLREYWRIIKRRKLIIVFTVVVMAIFSFISALLGKPVPIYVATSQVKVEKHVSFVGMNTMQALSGATNAMETQTHVIRSYYILELTAKKMGLIPSDLSPEEVRANNRYVNIILDLQERVKTEQLGNSELINITVTANEPKFATSFCNTVTEVYKTQHTLDLNRRTIEGKKFVEGQFGTSKEKLAKSEEAVKKFRERTKWTSFEAESTYLIGQVNKTQEILDGSAVVLQKVTAALRALDGAEITPLTSKQSFYFDEAPPPYKAMNDRLINLMVERDTLLITYTDSFPQVKTLRNQIHETIQSMRTLLQVQRRNLETNIRIYRNQLADLNQRFKALPEKNLELARLERDTAINKEVYGLLEKKYQETLIAEAEKLEEVKIVKPAIEPTAAINPPKVGTNTILGTILGLILGVVFAFLIETFDTSIAAIEEVEDFLGVHVMGVIPFVSVDEIKTLLSDDPNTVFEEDKLRRYARLASHFVPSSTLAESYKALRTSLNFACLENDYKSIVFTSSSPGEGKTSIVVNLAITMAQIGKKVLLIDGDLRRPVVSKLFGIEQTPGLTDVVLGNNEWHSVVRSITDLMMGKMSIEDIMKTPGLDNLFIITSGTYSPNPAEILNSRAIGDFLEKIKTEYDVILVDAPPVLAATDAALWSSRVDSTVIVYQVGKIARGALKRSKISLENLKANIVGIVLNGLKAEISPDFGYQDYYYYYYGTEKTQPKNLSAKVKESILSGPVTVLSAVKNLLGMKTKPIVTEEASSTSVGKTTRKTDTETVAEAPAKAVAKTRHAVQGSATPKSRLGVFKIILLALAALLLLVGVLYRMGMLPMPRKTETRRPPVSAPLPVKPTESGKPQAASPLSFEAPTLVTFVAPDESRPYAVQVRSVPTEQEAQQFVETLKERGMNAFFQKVLIKGQGAWYRVFIGRFATPDDAQRYLVNQAVTTLYPGSFIQNTSAM